MTKVRIAWIASFTLLILSLVVWFAGRAISSPMPWTSNEQSLLFGQYNATPPTLGDGQIFGLQLDPKGNVKTADQSFSSATSPGYFRLQDGSAPMYWPSTVLARSRLRISHSELPEFQMPACLA